MIKREDSPLNQIADEAWGAKFMLGDLKMSDETIAGKFTKKMLHEAIRLMKENKDPKKEEDNNATTDQRTIG